MPRAAARKTDRTTADSQTSAEHEWPGAVAGAHPAEPAADSAAKASAGNSSGRLGVVPIVLIMSAAVCLMLLAFAAPSVKSGPHKLPIAVSGPAPAVAKVSGLLETKQPGAFTVKKFANEQAGADAIRHRKAVGGIAVSPAGITVQTASGAGQPYGNILKAIGAGMSAQGQKVTYTDLAPLTRHDPFGAAITSLGLPLVFGGMGSAVLLATQMRGGRIRRVIGALAFSAAAGMLATLILRFWLKAFDTDYWLIAGAVAMGVGAISLTVLGLESFLGYAGLGLGAATMLLISNPLSGLASGPQWLPHPWGTIGQFLPVGAAGTVIRSGAYFDGHGATRASIVLFCWMLFGVTLTLLSALHRHVKSRRPASATA